MFKINDIVAVKPGTEDPDFGGDIGGWQGRIIEIDVDDPDNTWITVEWDANTLKNMPRDYLKRCFREGFDHESMVLGVSDLIPANPSDTNENRASVLESLNQEYAWEDLGEQGMRIKAVEDACENDYALMDHWFEYLENHVVLPVQAKFIGDSGPNLPYGALIEIRGFDDADDDYGVIGYVLHGKRRLQVPLGDVEILEVTPAAQALDDYIVWFANR